MENDVSCIPEPIGMDSQKHCALYSFLLGERPKKITERHIRQTAAFIKQINKYKNEESAKALHSASDSCFSIQDHLDLVNKRIERFSNFITNLEIENKANLFVCEQLIPAWEIIKRRITGTMTSAEINEPINRTSWILSPSDFGFHNTLEHDEELSFIDFEYAGWDDPAKLICDFVCQPEIPVNSSQAELFVNELVNDFSEGESIITRIKYLLPVHRLKWCCILLNEFFPRDLQRRLHAGKSGENLLSEQLEKAIKYFNDHLKNN